MNTLEIIKKYNLSVRKIPELVVKKLPFQYHEEGNKVEEIEVKKDPEKKYFDRMRGKGYFKSVHGFSWRNGAIHRKYTVNIQTPKNAGYWMCKSVGHTNSTVQWNKDRDHLAPTLEESVALFLKSTVN